MTSPRIDDILSQDDWLRRMARAIVHDPEELVIRWLLPEGQTELRFER